MAEQFEVQCWVGPDEGIKDIHEQQDCSTGPKRPDIPSQPTLLRTCCCAIDHESQAEACEEQAKWIEACCAVASSRHFRADSGGTNEAQQADWHIDQEDQRPRPNTEQETADRRTQRRSEEE